MDNFFFYKNINKNLSKGLVADQLISYPTCQKTTMTPTWNLKFSPQNWEKKKKKWAITQTDMWFQVSHTLFPYTSSHLIPYHIFVLHFCAVILPFWHSSSPFIPTFPNNHTQGTCKKSSVIRLNPTLQSKMTKLKHRFWHPNSLLKDSVYKWRHSHILMNFIWASILSI